MPSDVDWRLTQFKNSVSLVLEELLKELARTGAISNTEFPAKLETLAKQIEVEWKDEIRHWDVGMIRNLAHRLKPDYPSSIVENPEPPNPDNENP
jgi:hypothetical protein